MFPAVEFEDFELVQADSLGLWLISVSMVVMEQEPYIFFQPLTDLGLSTVDLFKVLSHLRGVLYAEYLIAYKTRLKGVVCVPNFFSS